MDDFNIELKPKKKSLFDKIKELFKDKKKRYLYMCLFILPFFVAMCIFGVVAYKGAMNLIELAKGESGVNEQYKIKSMKYSLRSNATDVQFQYFTELKNAIEVDGAKDEEIAGLVCKNFVADFYTWTNKQGQYDISALYYTFTPDKEVTYLKARDGFYKYLNTYINQYGADNLLEVASVDVTKASYANYEYEAANGEHFDNCIDVKCIWTYVANSKFDTSKYATSMNFLVVKRAGRFEIVEASENTIDARKVETNIQEEELESE